MELSVSRPGLMNRWLYSLKNRMIIVFLLSTLIPLLLSGGISYFYIISILNNKIQNSVYSNLRQVQISLENTLSNLNHVSQQLAFNGSIGRDMVKYLETEDILRRDELEKHIQMNVNMIKFSNPDLGQMFYYFEDKNKTVFNESLIEGAFASDKLPQLLKTAEMTYYGPHSTVLSRFIDRTVLSVTRKVDVPGYDNLRIYVETSFQLTENVLVADKSAMNLSYLFVDEQNRIAYSEDSQKFSPGMVYEPAVSRNGTLESRGNYLFEVQHNQGWKLVAAIPKGDFNKERNLWFRQFALFICMSIGIALTFSWIIWRMVRTPLGRFNNEIKRLHNSHFQSPLKRTKILEFDDVLHRFQLMKQQIWGLLQQIKEKEKRKTEMEIEKLLFQINPHFIHNTLDTIRWLAHSKGMYEIDNLITCLNRVLYYNMGKGGDSTIQEEVEALMSYVELQRIRYDFQFTVKVHADEQSNHRSIPRFILQPLVENCLYHGLRGDGVIEIHIDIEDDRYTVINVRDNGAGMKEEDIERLIHNQSKEQRQVGMGIGLYYVNRVIQAQFGDAAKFDIQSKLGVGTTMTLRIPLNTSKLEGVNEDAESIGS